MLLPRFAYHEPRTLTEALEMLARFGPQAKLLAGGTDLLVNLKIGRAKAREVVSLHRLRALRGLSRTKSGLKLGPLTTAAELAGLDLGFAQVLGRAAGRLGSPLIRHRATLGGNVVAARPAADLILPLLALGAQVVLASATGRRTVDLGKFCTGPGQTVIKPEEVLTGIIIPDPGPGFGGGYEKLGVRKTLEISIVNVAATLQLDENGTIRAARVVMGAVGPTPLRATTAEALLVGERPKGPNDPIIYGAGTSAVVNSCAIDDHRGGAGYRCQMVEVLTKRALAQAWLAAKESRA